jgi:hypothetical protein
MSAELYDLGLRRRFCAPRSAEVLEVATYELANVASAADLLRSVARITGISEGRLRRSWGGDEGLKLAAVRRALTLAFG